VKTFHYEAADRTGRLVRGIVPSESAALAIELLARQGLVPTRVGVVGERDLRLSRRELGTFFQSVSALVRAGIPLDGALGLQQDGPRIQKFAAKTRERIRQGESFWTAVTASAPMPATVEGLLKAGEQSGLTESLNSVARTLERDNQIRSELWAALAYPLVLLVVGTGATIAITFGILPRFASLLADVGGTLPFTTRALLHTTNFVGDHLVLLGGSLAATAIASGIWLPRRSGHAFLLRIPGVGPLRLQLATARAAQALGALLGVGAPAIDAVAAAGQAAADKELRDRYRRVAAHVRSGTALSTALAREHAMTELAISLVRIGEQSGATAVMFERAATLAESKAMRDLRTLVSLAEPAMILLLGSLIGFVALALLQAVYGMGIGG
jgi:type II secretory pathway component PulF